MNPVEPLARRTFLSGACALLPALAFAPDAVAQPSADLEHANIKVVTAMCESWKSGDAEKIASFMTEDLKFRGSAERMQAPPTADRQAFIESSRRFLATAKIEMVIHDTFARGSVVVNIHQQLFDVKDTGLREDWYIGVFHLVDGKIREWNDYAIVPFSSPRLPRPSGFGTFVHAS